MRVDGSRVQIRRARGDDAAAVAVLASELAQSFVFARERFDQAYPALVASKGVFEVNRGRVAARLPDVIAAV